MEMFEIKGGVWINLDMINRIRIMDNLTMIEYVNKDFQTVELNDEEDAKERLRAYIREANTY